MEKRPLARRHHYVPQAYLASFTSNGTKDGKFCVLDIHTGHAFRTSPLKVAVQRDFNRIDMEGHSPDAIECALAPFEGEAVAAIRRVIEIQSFPNDRDWNLILNLLGLIAVRNPKFRSSFNESRKQVLRRLADLLVEDKKTWDNHIKSAREEGEGVYESVSFEDVKRFVKEGQYRIEFHPEGNLRIEFSAFREQNGPGYD